MRVKGFLGSCAHMEWFSEMTALLRVKTASPHQSSPGTRQYSLYFTYILQAALLGSCAYDFYITNKESEGRRKKLSWLPGFIKLLSKSLLWVHPYLPCLLSSQRLLPISWWGYRASLLGAGDLSRLKEEEAQVCSSVFGWGLSSSCIVLPTPRGKDKCLVLRRTIDLLDSHPVSLSPTYSIVSFPHKTISPTILFGSCASLGPPDPVS